MSDQIIGLIEEFLVSLKGELQEVTDLAGLERIRVAHFGKKSPLKELFKRLGSLSQDEKVKVARHLNEAQASMTEWFEAKKKDVEAKATAERLKEEWVDLDMPATLGQRGAVHPIRLVEERCKAVLRQLGFTYADGPELELPYFNFDALNIPKHHPARDMQDTFWLEDGLLLRSHTTSVQARVLADRRPPPIKVVSAGRVYRNEAVDATHLAMFHQLEGFWLDRNLRFSDLKGVLTHVARAIYGAGRPIRFKPKYYPYTEPSLGIDVGCGLCQTKGCSACHGAGWVTIMGAGMIHPNVLTEFGYDPAEVSGIAFGWGTTRLTSQILGLSKLRPMYDGDLRFHHAVPRRMKRAFGA